MADLDGDASRQPGLDDALPAGHVGSQRLLDEYRHAAIERSKSQGHVRGRRRGDDEGVEVRLGDHRQWLGKALGARGPDSCREHVGHGIRHGHEAAVGPGRKDPDVVAAHRPQACQADAELGVSGRLPGCHYRVAVGAAWAANRAASPGLPSAWRMTADRTASMTVTCSSSVRPA